MTQTVGAPRAATRPGRRDAAAVGLFSATAFVGAGLLFLVQPMVARLLLPLYGGSATVALYASLAIVLAAARAARYEKECTSDTRIALS